MDIVRVRRQKRSVYKNVKGDFVMIFIEMCNRVCNLVVSIFKVINFYINVGWLVLGAMKYKIVLYVFVDFWLGSVFIE